MSRLLKFLLACGAAFSLAATAARSAVAIDNVEVTNVGTTTFTAVWTTSEVSTPALAIYSDSAGTNPVGSGLGFEYYPIAEANPTVFNNAAARESRRALEVLAINRRVVSVRVTGLAPGTSYYFRPRTFGEGGVDNGTGLLPLRQVTTAQVTSLVIDGRLLRVRFPSLSIEGAIALVRGPAATVGLSAIVGDSTAPDSAVFPLANFLDTATGTNALFANPQDFVIRLIGVGAPEGTFPYTVEFAAGFNPSKLNAISLGGPAPSPVFTTQPSNRTELAGATATFTVVASGTPAPTYRWQRFPAGGATWSDLVASATYLGVTTGTLQVAGVTSAMSGDQFRAIATNGVPPDATSDAATLTVNPVAPVFVSTPSLSATAVQGLNFLFGPVTINATPATFSATGLPPGLTVNALNGDISGIPAVVGTLPAGFVVVLRVENSTGFDTRTIALTVNPAPPQITSVAAASGQVNLTFNYAITATHAPTSFAATGLPLGLSVVDASIGVITGIPLQAGTFNATVTATNAGGTGSQALVLTIAPAPSAPVYSGSLNSAGTQGTAFSFQPVFSGSPTVYALVGSQLLPNGVTLNTATGAITGTPTVVGVFPIKLRATNAGGSTDVDLQITINPAPAAPVITSANTVTTTVGASFSFTLTASGVPAVYTFTANDRPGWLNLDPATGVLSGTPVLGTYTLHVYASNSPSVGVTQQGPQSVLIITVSASPNAPVINSASVVQGRVGVPLNYQLTASPSASSFAITSAAPPSWLSLNGSSGLVSGTPTQAGPVHVTFAAASTLFGQGPTQDVLFEIAPALLAPEITSGSTAQGQVNQPFQYTITATNGPLTGYALTGALPGGLTFNAATGIISGIPLASTTTPVAVSLTASNAAGTSPTKILEITIQPPPATSVITSSLLANGKVGVAFNYQITASENPTSFLATGLPDNLVVNPGTGLISGTPTVAGNFSVTLRAGNANGLGAPATLQLTIVSGLGAPRITSAPAAAGYVGAEFSYSATAEPGPIVSYALTGDLPVGLTFNTATGVLSGRPASAGLYITSLTATNAAGTSQPQPLVILIVPAPGAPVITSPSYDTATVGVPYQYQITASNMTDTRPLVSPNSLNALNLPPGLAVNSTLGIIEGTPTTAGTYVINLFGTNAVGTGAQRELRLVIAPSPSAPVITSASTAAGRAGTPFFYAITATNNPTAYEVRDAPPWMTVNSQNGTIGGTPPVPGKFVVRVLARNSAGASAPMAVTVTISPAANTPVITSTGTIQGKLGTSFTFAVTTSPAATAFTATGLPPGLAIDGATGVISGIPLASGQFNVNVTASNAQGQGAPKVLNVHIQPNKKLL